MIRFLNSVKLSNSLLLIKKELKKKKLHQKHELSAKEEALIKQITDQTISCNQNNITRTKAYLDYYRKHPELHWAFLAHMVSRNAGWNMSDLKGTLLSKILTEQESSSYFTFLERGNWLIFQDAYPQLLLYEQSKKNNSNLFHLLLHFNVSTFMEAVWMHYYQYRNSTIVTTALIVNEQNFIEFPLVQNPTFQKSILKTLAFKLHDFLSMNQIIFPYQQAGKVRMTGKTLHHFESVQSRIQFGKKLYAILFGNKERLKLVESWAFSTPHTASRKDYNAALFNDLNEDVPTKKLKRRLHHCQISKGSPRFYSPPLQYAWKNYEHEQPVTRDWYQNWQVLFYLTEQLEKLDTDMEVEHCQTLEKMELAAIAKQAVSFRENENTSRFS